MKTILCSLLIIAFFSSVSAQSRDTLIMKKNNDLIVDIDTLVGIRNKRIVFDFDTLYMINKLGVNTFVKCVNTLNKLKKDLPFQLNELSVGLSDIQSNVDSMYLNMKSVTTFINGYEKDTKLKLDALSEKNTELSNSLDGVQKELEVAGQNIKAEKLKSKGAKFLWGAGGFALGGLLFTSLMLLK